MTNRSKLPVTVLMALAVAGLAACGPGSSTSASAPASSAPAAQAAAKGPANAAGTVSAKAACEALALWESNSSGNIATDTALQETFQDTTHPLSVDFADWVSDIKGGISLADVDAGEVSLDCKAEGVTVFPSDSASAPPPASAPAPVAPSPQTVTFKVSGSYAQVTYGPAGSNTSGTVPMKVTDKLGNPLYYALTAQLQGGGSVSCEIEVDGAVISKSTASGGYNIAQCEISNDPISGGWKDTNTG